ncbi:MAG: carbon storage regulator CsrA [Porcipelethomonas sp.]
MLILSRKSGESLFINEEIEIKLIEVSGDKVKIGVNAPQNVKVLRGELRQTMKSNIESSESISRKQLFEMLNGIKKDAEESK